MLSNEQEFPVIGLVDNVLAHAITKSASDIHFEPMANQLRIRLRIDGVLYDLEPVDHAVMQQMLSRLKVLANINIAEKRIPQDGKFRILKNSYEIDLRVSTFPTVHGEKIVVRILDRIDRSILLSNLGFLPDILDQIYTLISKSSGFFLVAGPTGSGKTTTLYAALEAINSPEKNIITLEDPVEYSIPGVSQGQIHPDAGFTFEKGIRSLLRQDPDIVMIGEIRDKQTAGIAIEAALTGHLVFSSIHTNDAPSVVMRLMDMGIEPYLINAAVTGVLAQRLARKLCSLCKIERKPSDQELTILKKYGVEPLEYVFQAKGCSDCLGLGYRGRIGIFELLLLSSSLRSLIVQSPAFEQICQQATLDGMRSLFQDGLQKVRDGIISFSELIRVVI